MVNEIKEVKEMLKELKTEKEINHIQYEHTQERKQPHYNNMYNHHKKPYQKRQNYFRQTGTFNIYQQRQNTHIRFYSLKSSTAFRF